MTVEGIDISTWQTTTPPLGGLGFVFVRSSYGTSLDARYVMHAGHVRAAGLVLGAYHYWYPGDPAGQALTFLGVAGGADLLALDLEGPASGTAQAHTEIRDMIARLHSAGRKVGLYHSLSGFPDLGQDFDWVAYWNATPPARAWDFWQYTGGPLDRNRWHGDMTALMALVHSAGGPNAQEVDPVISNVKGEDWKAKYGILRDRPDTAGKTIAVLPAGTVIRSIAEVSVPGSAYSWRLTKYGGQVAYFTTRRVSDGAFPDWAPLVAGGDPAVNAGLSSYIARAPAGFTQADLDAAKAAAAKAGYDDAKAKAIAGVQSI